MSLLDKIFGTFSDKELKRIRPLVDQVFALEPKYQAMSNQELQAVTPALKQRLANGETLDDILPDAYAACREASWRVMSVPTVSAMICVYRPFKKNLITL